MGAEYTKPPRTPALNEFIEEAFGRRNFRRDLRCFKCLGHGKIFTEYECTVCRVQDLTTWSGYNGQCTSCNGYGRQSVYTLCDDCFGRGYK